MQKLQLKDLIQSLGDDPKHSHTINTAEQFLSTAPQQLKSLPLRQQLRLKREGTYRNTQQEMDKWIGIVKLNREKDTLNLVKKEKDNGGGIGFFPNAPISQFHQKLQNQLKHMEIGSQQSVMKREEEALGKLTKEEAQERLKEARRRRTAQFNQEVKRRRMAKIKSKLYRKIKKRQKVREEAKRVTELQGEEKKDYMQKLAKQRVKERITLRHRSKNKHIQNLLRFSKNNKQTVQESINEVNAIRQQQLQKLNEQFQEQLSQEEQGFSEGQNLEHLQQQIDEMQNQNKQKPKGLDAMKFMQIERQKQLQKHQEDAKIFEKMLNEDEDSGNEHLQIEGDITRKVFGEETTNRKEQTGGINYIQRNLKKALGGESKLTEGINVNRLKDKYQPQRSNLNLTEAIKIHKQAFEGENEVVEQNYQQFEKEKYLNYEAELPVEKKQLKGWGGWAGPGISQPKIDQAAEVRKKLARIEQIKRKRRDGQMAGVIIRETYNKDLKDYFVNKLPYNMKSAEQFDYLQREALGPEWNTLSQFTANVQPKVLTKAGQVIQPIKMPKHIDKRKK